MTKSIFYKTPLLRHPFGNALGPKILLKYDFLQPSGSFKSRGIGHLISTELEEIKKKKGLKGHVFSSSGGNAGLAAAIAASQLNIDCTVVVSNATRTRLIDKIKRYGAEVIVHGSHWKEADTFMRNEVMIKIDKSKIQPIYAHPFDNPTIWEGHSLMVDEIVESLSKLSIPADKIKGIICSFGGGGLYNGLILGLERHKLANSIPVIAVETKGAHVLDTSLKCGKIVEFEEISSCATSLGTATISAKAFENFQKYNSKNVVLDDIDAIRSCIQFSEDTNIITEPGCGATLYFGYNNRRINEVLGNKLAIDDVIILIGCGGSSTVLEDLMLLSKTTTPSYIANNLEQKVASSNEL